MPSGQRDKHDDRAARIEMLLEELRLNTEDMLELSRQARERAIESQRQTRPASNPPRTERPRKKR